jgi:hypothetical protein
LSSLIDTTGVEETQGLLPSLTQTVEIAHSASARLLRKRRIS